MQQQSILRDPPPPILVLCFIVGAILTYTNMLHLKKLKPK